MKIAIIIPVYNAENSIETCLVSLMAQDRKADIVTVVDNYSTDGTYEFLEELIKKRNWEIELLRESKKGASAARNCGIRSLKENIDIVAFTDADCIVRKDWLKNIEEFFLEHKDVAALGGIAAGYKPENLMQKFLAIERLCMLETRLSGLANDKTGALRGTMIDTNNAAFRKDVLEEVEGFDEQMRISEDTDISLRIIERGHIIYVAHQHVVVFHRDSPFFLGYLKKFLRYRTEEMFMIKRHFKNRAIFKIPFREPIILSGSPITTLISLKFIAAFALLIVGLKFYFILIAGFIVYLAVLAVRIARIFSQKPELNISPRYCIVFAILFMITRMLGPVGRIRGSFRYRMIAM